MPRTPTTDRNNVTAEDSPVIAMRLTPREATALDVLVRMQNTQAEAMGIAAAVTRASAMRALLRQAAKAKGIWDEPDASPVAEPQADLAADLATVLDAATAELARSNAAPLVMVAAVVRASKLPTERAHAALNEAVQRGELELRPESGMGRLSKADAALCVPGPQGSMLSVLRVIGAEVPAPKVNPTKSAKVEKADDERDLTYIHKRYLKALDDGKLQAREAGTAIFGEMTDKEWKQSKQSMLSRFKKNGFVGKGKLSKDHAPKLAAFLRKVGC